jgi:hypothetical protein
MTRRMLTYFPPVELLSRALGFECRTILPIRSDRELVICKLIQSSLRMLKIDIESYLACNPDLLRMALPKEDVESHFLSNGYFEGRVGWVIFDENYYVERYEDVQAAIKNGAMKSGLHHFRLVGYGELRSPTAFAEPEVHEWAHVLSRFS